MSMIRVPALPFPLVPSVDVPWDLRETGALAATGAAGTDIFVPPASGDAKLDAATLLGEAPTGDFRLSARVTVDFRATFDAGVLLLWLDEAHWAKLCFEYTPDGRPMVVSVVNRTVSDDANAFAVEDRTAWLRISRTGGVYALHASIDGARWEMVRIFALDAPGAVPRIGFEVQSPTGQGCDVVFDEITFAGVGLADERDGS